MVKSYFELSRWGDKTVSEPIEENLIALLEKQLGITIDLMHPKLVNEEPIVDLKPSEHPTGFIEGLSKIVGKDNVSDSTDDRLNNSIGKSYFDAIRARTNTLTSYPQLVVCPRTEEDVIQILTLCEKDGVPVVPIGGKSSVTQGINYDNGGIALDLTRHMNKIIHIDALNQSVQVEPGMYGPEFEKQLNETQVGHEFGYTCGHFPQSFEYSTVGGWLATRGAGQESTGYGKIEHMVLGLRMVTPKGVLAIREFPARSTGPDLIQLIIGSEGIFGIITEITMKIHRRYPKNTKYFAILFKDWEKSLTAVREIMQQRIGHPFIFRLSDPEETFVSIETVGLPSWQEKGLNLFGYRPMERTLLMGSLEGNGAYTKMMKKQLKKISKKYGGLSIGSSATRHWLETRYSSSYLRDSFISAGLVLDTLETSCTWSNILHVWKSVRDMIKERGNIILMTHLSHMYENGANLYFIFMYKAEDGNELKEFAPFHKKIVEAIVESGGSLSHHHGVGSLLSPYLEKEIGSTGYEVLHSIKKILDPKNILNPKVMFGDMN